ncbi:hypothetical protein BCU68_14025 [Vibrio sp. 10N.286.49.B3]|uniref:YtfJ family protein n=1 Tax=Vibrio sp. 10N.286.49.B3 TaxID=1880855 RepID=UPI000C8398C3|nr:YtfJ family protein [Vibrio sp. 10N.286.49.B3]PMH42552.1 hypothetical protein BCU68_14025 [Vibrio sp. 10N.286.49.B3]
MTNKALLTALLACTPMLSSAHNLTLGQTTPPVTISDQGEIMVQEKKVSYQEWSNTQMLGKVRVIQAIAGRSGAKKMNAELMTAITAANFSAEDYQTTTVINQDDAVWGTGSFVKSSAQDSKKEFPWSSMVLDKTGLLASTWDLQPESSAIIVQDKQGKVLFIKEGALSESEINSVLELIHTNL